MKERPSRWSVPVRVVHWLMAVLLVGLIGLGWAMTHLRYDLGTTFTLFQWHKSYGLLVLPLLALRLLLRLSPRPPAVEHSAFERIGARIGHVSFYVLMLALPLCGWLMASASPLSLPTRPFNLFTLPSPVAPDEALFERLRLLHEVLAYGLLALLGLHIAAALKHQFWDRDGILRRMIF